MRSNGDLPRDWAVARLGEFCAGRGRSVDPRRRPDEDFELYSVPSYDTGKPDIVKGREIRSAKQEVLPHTVLLCGINPRINRTWVVREKTQYTQIASTEWLCFPPNPAFESAFLRYYMMQSWFRDFLAQNAVGVGGSLMRVKKNTLAELPVYVPPLVEQRAIVAKIEALFSELDKGIEQLQTIKQQLKQYRQAVLKAAFEGKLTAEWRSRQQAAGKLRSTNDLLEEINKAREERYRQQVREWEQAVAEWEAAGGTKSGRKKPSRPTKLRSLTNVDKSKISTYPDLPEGWTWVRCGELLYSFKSGSTVVPQDDASPLPILRSSAVRSGFVDLNDVRYVPPGSSIGDKDLLADGDLLFTRLSGSVDYVGLCAAVTGLGERSVAYPDRIFCGKPVIPPLAKYIVAMFASPMVRRELEAKAKSTAGHMRVSMSDILDQPLPLPPAVELEIITQAVESRLSLVDQLEKTVDRGLQKARALRQSILRKAFEGRLLSEAELAAVRNDPEYEPADMMLERIRAEGKQHARQSMAKRTRTTAQPNSRRRSEKSAEETVNSAR